MCKKTNFKTSNTHIDRCIRNLVRYLKAKGYETQGSCCGHGKYPVTIVMRGIKCPLELFTGITIPRKRRFYKRDKQGYYYLPELQECFTIKEKSNV